jgi:16S rRNA (cytosine967-C5)-methyltransferase
MDGTMDVRNSREISLVVLERVEQTEAFAKEVLERRIENGRLSRRDRGLARELTYGTLRWRGYIDAGLNELLRHDLGTLPCSIRNILRLGAYQLLFLERVPDFAAINESVALARRHGHAGTAGLVNAVLRRVAQRRDEFPLFSEEADGIERLAIRCSHPRWLVERWVGCWGEDATYDLCCAANRTPPFVVRVNSLRTDRESLLRRLRAEGVECEAGRYVEEAIRLTGRVDLMRLKTFREGLFQAQDESAMAVTALLDPQPGERIVDLCSAPGGKAGHISERTGGEALVLAVELREARLRHMLANVKRLGIRRLAPIVADGTTFPARGAARVLVDAPCSGTGVLRRRADLRWRLREESIGDLTRVQAALLENAARLVLPGGVIVYSTCTLESEENESIVEAFLRGHEEFRLENASQFVHHDLVDAAGYVRTFPHIHDLDGTYAARLVRTDRI